MKQLLRRVVVKDGIAIKQLPYVIEHDAIKAIYTESDKQDIPVSQEYKTKNHLSTDIDTVFHITIKWMDGDTSNITVTEGSGDTLFNYVFISFDNLYNAEIDHNIKNEEGDEEVDYEEEYDEEDDDQPMLPFPTSVK